MPESLLHVITPLILTYNEAPNIGRTLAKLHWAKRIVVIDSGSTDKTLEMVQAVPNTEMVQRPFDDHASQWNYGLAQIKTPWVLSLDADYILSDALVNELDNLFSTAGASGYEASFIYCINSRPLRGTLYPSRVVLFRKEFARYFNTGHTQRLELEGPVERLNAPIYHDDRKPLARWFASQQAYAKKEADYLLSQRREKLRRIDSLRMIGWPAPPLVFIYTLLVKRCLLDGWPGWLYVLQRTLAETMIALEIVNSRMQAQNYMLPDSKELAGALNSLASDAAKKCPT